MTLSSLLKPYLAPFYRGFIGILGLNLVAIGFQLATPWPFQILLDNVLGSIPPEPGTLLDRWFEALGSIQTAAYFVVGLYCLIYLLSHLATAVTGIFTNSVMRRLIQNFSTALFARAQTLDIGYYRTREVGDYLYRLSYDASSIGAYVEFGLLPLFTSGLYLAIAGLVLISIDLRLAIVTFLGLPLLAYTTHRFNGRITAASSDSEIHNSTLYSFIQQNLSQLKVVQAYRQESGQTRAYHQRLSRSLEADFTVNNLNVLLSLAMGVIITFIYTLIIGLGSQLVLAGAMTSGLLVVFIFYLDHLTSPILQIVDAVTTLKEEAVRLDRLKEFFETDHQVLDTGAITDLKDTEIRFNSVSLKDPSGRLILDQISCTLPAKRTTAIIGLSGSGKSSLTSLIMRLINEPASGHIMIGGYHTRDYQLSVLRDNIAFVPQETELFNDTIYNLIAFGKPQATPEQVYAAAKLAQADRFILRHPGGYQFKVGERGELLSGGQRQRLLLARAYLKNAPIMIVDEIFAFQDPETKRQMVQALRQKTIGKTLVLVTNTLDVIAPTDHLILIHQGKIIYQGDHAGITQAEMVLHLLNQASQKEN